MFLKDKKLSKNISNASLRVITHAYIGQNLILLCNLPPGTTQDQVRVTMSTVGQVEHIEPSRSKKSIVVQMKTAAQAKKAVAQYDGKMLPGKV